MDHPESVRRPNALVTGGAHRLGRAIALDLARHGWNVAVHHHRSSRLAAEVVAAIGRLGGRAVALGADLTGWDQAAGLVARAAAALGPITLLVNNAAIFEHDRPGTVTRESWDRHMHLDLRAPLALSQALSSELAEGTTGNVINLIDQRVLNPTPHYTSYTIAKMGLWDLTRHLAVALAPRVRVNAIAPGVIDLQDPADATNAEWARATPLGRGPDGAEICRALRSILDSPSMTGQLIVLDGGQHLGWLPPAQASDP
jgi:NAD(P)-dependent dehydrogenase (short-subunit alcohol dehydrogenase family)